EAFTANASFQSASGGNQLVVTGTSAADIIQVERSSDNGTYLTVTVNGRIEYAGVFASLNSIVVHGGGGGDLIVINQVPTSVPVSVFGEAGDDAMYVVVPPDFVGRTAGSVRVDGGLG